MKIKKKKKWKENPGDITVQHCKVDDDFSAQDDRLQSHNY